MPKIVFDTSIVMEVPELLYKYKDIVLPIKVVEELDNLKHNGNSEQKMKARKANNILNEICNIEYRIHTSSTLPLGFSNGKPDNEILSCAKDVNAKLVTMDKNMAIKAKALGIDYEFHIDNVEEFTGWKIVEMTDAQLASWYEASQKKNDFDLLINQYLLIRNKKQLVDLWRYTSNGFVTPSRKEFKSAHLGKIKVKDYYQQMVFDSLINDKLTILTGHSGTGKTLLSLSYLLWALENGRIDKIYIIHNPQPLYGAKEMGFYPGNPIEKIMNSNLGHILTTKLGDSQKIDFMLNNNQLEIIPAQDIRGVEIPDNCALFVTEAQNMSTYMVKTIIQRCGNLTKIILEGDIDTQVDHYIFNNDNGLKSAIRTFKNDFECGCVNLVNIYRNRLAQIAEAM